jgi:hypothetical protein
MPTKTGQLHTCDGAVVEVVVQLSGTEKTRRQQLGEPVPVPQAVKAQLDTGASRSVVHLGILQGDLRLARIDVEKFNELAGGETQREIFLVDLSILVNGCNGSWGPTRVAGGDLTNYGFKAVIGRDLLAGCVLVYDGKTNSFSLSF